MATTIDDDRREIEALLPWHATGVLSGPEAERVDAALATDAELAQQSVAVREELAQTIHLNETLGIPSARAIERLLAKIRTRR
jgi:anti-sigma-K factor RskA